MFRKLFKVLCLLQVLLVPGSDGCRWDKTQDAKSNTKNQSADRKQLSGEVSLEQYFIRCLQKFQYHGQPDIPTIVTFTIRHSTWFSITKTQYCALGAVACWQYLVGEYIRTDSQYLAPARSCIQQYGRDADLPGKVSSLEFVTNPPKETASKQNISVDKFKDQLQRLWSPEDPDDHSLRNLSTLVSFMQEDVVCGLDFCDCAELVLPPKEQCGDNWYSRIPAITRNDSINKKILLDSSNFVIKEAQLWSPRTPTTSYRLLSNLTHKPPISLPKQVFMPVLPLLSDITEDNDLLDNQTIFEGPAPTFRTPADIQRPPQLTYFKLLQIFIAIRSTASQSENSTTESNVNS